MPARVLRVVSLALAISLSVSRTCFALESPPTARPAPPNTSPSPSPTPFLGFVLPQGSEVTLLLASEVTSAAVHDGSTIPMTLKTPLVVNGVIVADAGTQTVLRVLKVHHSGAGMVDASMQIALDPLPLRTGGTLPIRLPRELLSISHSAGEQSTTDLTDMASAIVFPGLLLIHAIQKGKEVRLPAGTPIQAYTMAALDARDRNAVVVASPRPLIMNSDSVHAEYSPAPFVAAPTPSPRSTRKAVATPSPAASPLPGASLPPSSP